MQSVELLGSIPSRKFHSAIFTSYNINLYYWEMGVMRILGNKGIGYVSAVIDSAMLSEELLYYTEKLNCKQKPYALFGYHAQGAFHPKIMFFAGNETILVLVGSGNITPSGHGRNIETWNSVMVDSKDDEKLGFVREVWQYISNIYNSIGRQAREIVSTIEAHCSLLQEEIVPSGNREYPFDKGTIRFFCRNSEPIINQLYAWTGNDIIDKITVLSPFYDGNGMLLQHLNEHYKPESLNVIYEDGFGNIPSKSENDNVQYFNWEKIENSIKDIKTLGKIYHAKCFFLHGSHFNYMLTGSANASIAAFGEDDHIGTNFEACVGYKSQTVDFQEYSGIILDNVQSEHTIPVPMSTDSNSFDKGSAYVIIKEAVVDGNVVSIDAVNLKIDQQYKLCFHSSEADKSIGIESKNGIQRIEFDFVSIPIYVYISTIDDKVVSNRQMMVYKEVMDSNDPSEFNRRLKEFCHSLGNGDILSPKVLEYMTDIMMGESKKKITVYNSTTKKERQVSIDIQHYDSEEEFNKEDLSEEYYEQKVRKHDRSTELIFDSVLSFIRNSYEQETEDNDDEEENLDMDKPVKKTVNRNYIYDSTQNYKRTRNRIVSALDKFADNLSKKVVWYVKGRTTVPQDKPNLDDLMKYVLALGVILRVIGTTVKIKDGEMAGEEKHYLTLTMSEDYNIVTHLHKSIGLFTLWINQQQGFVQYETTYQQEHLIRYVKEAYGLSMACISLCDLFNQQDKNYQQSDQIIIHKELLMNIRENLGYCSKPEDYMQDVLSKIDGDIRHLEIFDEISFKDIVQQNLNVLDSMPIGHNVGEMVMTRELGATVITRTYANPDIVQIDSFLKRYISFDTEVQGSDNYSYSYKKAQVIRSRKR